MTELYGIPNCDTVKKARNWLTENDIAYAFCDFKKTPPTPEQIGAWLEQLDVQVLLNKRGTTWRKLSPDEQAQADTREGAVQLMAANPSVIKRPLLQHEGQWYCGFDAGRYAAVFGK